MRPGAASRIGLFGGSFDPVHVAHLALARLARDALALDRLLWIPAGQPWQKDRPMTAARHREAMLRLAIDGEPRFELARLELDRSGPSYTIDTVRALQAELPGAHWTLIIGEDQYRRFDTWRDWRALLASTTLAVAGRDLPSSGAESTLPDEIRRTPHAVVALPAMPVSSTDIRARLAAGQPIDDVVPPEVARYIVRHGLYGSQGSDAGPLPPPAAAFTESRPPGARPASLEPRS